MNKPTFDPRKAFGQAVSQYANKDSRIVILSADSGKSSGFGEFAQKFPERYFEFGIMEQGVIGFASGLATTGKIPIFCAIAPFVTARPFEMLRNDCGYMHQNVKIVGRNGGMTYSDLGSTHHSLEDYAITRMIPNFVVLAPQDICEIETSVKAMIEHQGPVYMRIGSQALTKEFEDESFVIGQATIRKTGKDVTIISTGYVYQDVLAAIKKLQKENIEAEWISMPTIKPLDTKTLLESVKKTRKVVVVEEHYVVGGLASAIIEVLSEFDPVKVKRIGLPHLFVSSGPYDALKKKYNVDATGIYNQIKAFLSII